MLKGKLDCGLNNIKFSLNHGYRFDSPFVAFIVGWAQTVSILWIEIVNFIVILTSISILDTVMNFIALVVIAEFDNAFFSSLGTEDLKQIVGQPEYDDLYQWTRTTSLNASPDCADNGL